jgi:hypothetical protein
MSIGQLRNQMVGEPTRVPGFAEGYGQAPGQARPSMPPQPNPIGRPSLVVGGPAYYTPPGFQAPPQPTESFLPTDRRPDPIGQQFMRQMESPMGQQFQQQYEATQAPIRQAEQERQQAELIKRDERLQGLMDRISELEGQLSSQEEAPVMPNIPTFPIGRDFEIDFSQIPNFGNFLNFGNQMEPVEREDYQDLMSEINNLPSPPPIVQDPNEVVFRGGPAQQFTDLPTDLPLPGSEIDLSKLDQSLAEKVKRSLAAGMPVFQRDRSIIGPSMDRLPPMSVAPVMPSAPTSSSPMAPVNLPRPMVPMDVFSKLNKGPGI